MTTRSTDPSVPQAHQRPYISARNNQFEFFLLLVQFATLSSGVLFYADRFEDGASRQLTMSFVVYGASAALVILPLCR